MMNQDIEYSFQSDGLAVVASHHGSIVGRISYVRIGLDKIMIENTSVEPEYRNRKIGLTLVRNVVEMARAQQRKVITMCPFARAMFNRYSEFDDIRLMHVHQV